MLRFRSFVLDLLLVLSTLSLAANASSNCPHYTLPVAVGVLQTKTITETSGIVASKFNPGVFWIHEDSGSEPKVYAVSLSGKLLTTCTLKGVQAIDWEDIAIGPGPQGDSYLYLGDIGDNAFRRADITVYRFLEPLLEPKTPAITIDARDIEAFHLVYPNPPHDAETLLVDPLSGDLYVITKWESKSRIYRARLQDQEETTLLEYMGDLPFSGATGGDISCDGRMIIIRTYFAAYIWVEDAKEPLWKAIERAACRVSIATEPQGEAICFSSDTEFFVTISEGKHPTIYQSRRVSN